ncbi:MAG: beta-ketoacyl-ACP synthase II [Porcipelethomonas sp.]
MKKRVVITGMGAVTPIGNSVPEFWENVRKGVVGIGEITHFDTEGYKVKLAAEVKNFDPKDYMNPKIVRRAGRFTQFALAAAREAFETSKIDMSDENPYRIGVCIGCGTGGLQLIQNEHRKLLEKGPSRISPLFVPMFISNMASSNVSISLGLKGKNINIVTACATGNQCIGEAFRTIQYGDADIMLAGGTEASITELGISGFANMTALSTQTDPLKASVPFDKDRSGFVMGEGSGVIVLEELQHALDRNADILAEIVGYGTTSDAYHITSPEESAEAASYAIKAALADAGLKPQDIDYINAHGTGTHLNELFETKAIKKALGEYALKCKVSSTKSLTGHLLGGAGGVEAIVCIKSILDNYVHVNAGLENQDPECDLDCVMDHGIDYTVKTALSNSLGFGGHNAVLIFTEY